MSKLLLCLSLVLLIHSDMGIYASENSKEYSAIKGFTVGFENSNAADDPANGQMGKFGYNGAVAFPYAYRCLGIKRNNQQVVSCIEINLLKINKISKEKSSGLNSGLEIYASNDNKHYTKLPRTYEIKTVSSGEYEKTIVTGLSIAEKYIKLRCVRTKSSYTYGYKKWQNCIKLFKLKKADIGYLDVPRFSGEKLAFKAAVSGRKGMVAELAVEINGKWRQIWNKELIEKSQTISEKIKFKHALYGKKNIRLVIKDKDGNPAAENTVSSFFCKGIVRENPQPGELCFVNISRNDVVGNWVTKSALTPHGKRLDYYKSMSSGDKISVKLPAVGWCAVYVGVVGGDSRFQVAVGGKIMELEYWRKDVLPGKNAYGEVFAGIQELKDGDVLKILRYKNAPLKVSCVRIQRLLPEQVALIKSKTILVPRMIVHNDGFSGFFVGALNSKQSLEDAVDQYKGASLYSYDWSLGTSTRFNIKTTQGCSLGEGDDSKYWREGDKKAGRLVQKLLKAGVSPLQVVAAEGKKDKIHVNVTLRMSACYRPPQAACHNGPFLNDNKSIRISDLSGQRQWKISYAYPEVRSFLLSVLKDALKLGPDGIHLQFLRHPPFFGYDKPLVEAYKQRYGKFEKSDYMNDKWQKLQCEMMTQFVGKVRELLDEESKKRGQKLTFSVSFDQGGYYRQGLDVRKWVKAGWLDVISPGCYGSSGAAVPMKQFADMVRGTNCKIFPQVEATLEGHDPTPDEEKGLIKVKRVSMSLNHFKKIFMLMHDQGAYGLYPFNFSHKALVKELADMRGLKIWREFKAPFIDWFVELKEHN